MIYRHPARVEPPIEEDAFFLRLRRARRKNRHLSVAVITVLLALTGSVAFLLTRDARAVPASVSMALQSRSAIDEAHARLEEDDATFAENMYRARPGELGGVVAFSYDIPVTVIGPGFSALPSGGSRAVAEAHAKVSEAEKLHSSGQYQAAMELVAGLRVPRGTREIIVMRAGVDPLFPTFLDHVSARAYVYDFDAKKITCVFHVEATNVPSTDANKRLAEEALRMSSADHCPPIIVH